MNTQCRLVSFLLALLIITTHTGCVTFRHYELTARNATPGVVDRVRVTFDEEKHFEWGVMGHNVEKSALLMPGPLGRMAVIEWEDTAKKQYRQSVLIPRNKVWNAIEFTLEKDGTVSVKTQWK